MLDYVILNKDESAKLRKLYNTPYSGVCGFCGKSGCLGHRIAWPRSMVPRSMVPRSMVSKDKEV